MVSPALTKNRFHFIDLRVEITARDATDRAHLTDVKRQPVRAIKLRLNQTQSAIVGARCFFNQQPQLHDTGDEVKNWFLQAAQRRALLQQVVQATKLSLSQLNDELRLLLADLQIPQHRLTYLLEFSVGWCDPCHVRATPMRERPLNHFAHRGNMSPLTAMSLFAGAGGLDLGFQRANYRILWANEIDPNAAATYRQTFRETSGDPSRLQVGDMSQLLAAHQVPQLPVDVVFGGPPCQGFSHAGAQRLEDPRSQLVHRFFDVIEHVKPRAFVMENVSALGSHQRWKPTREQLIERARHAGYRVETWLLDAANHGVPQRRQRFFIIGTPHGSRPLATPPSQPPISVREALQVLPRFGDPGNHTRCRAAVTAAKHPVLRPNPYSGMLFNGGGRPIDLNKPSPTITATFGGNRTHIIDQAWLDGIATTDWVCEYHHHLKYGGAPATEVPSRLRRLTVEESAILQGFPPAATFTGSVTSQYRQIGNAVPPPLAEAVAQSLREVLS